MSARSNPSSARGEVKEPGGGNAGGKPVGGEDSKGRRDIYIGLAFSSSVAGGIINIHNPELGTSVERAARRPHAARPAQEEKKPGRGDGDRRTAKEPNRRVNTLLTLRREARKPNGIRSGDLVGGLRRPPAATAASAPGPLCPPAAALVPDERSSPNLLCLLGWKRASAMRSATVRTRACRFLLEQYRINRREK
ncbi:hypothetical protein KM043_016980 [Ampulex compressa]|nr:hypothetical protein KM043_016980 [Ampulex compressa]